MTDESAESSLTITAVLDRFEENLAVLLLESDDETIDELVVSQDDLPEHGRHQNAIFTVTVDEGTIVGIEYEPTETQDRTEATQRRFDRLARRPPSEDENS